MQAPNDYLAWSLQYGVAYDMIYQATEDELYKWCMRKGPIGDQIRQHDTNPCGRGAFRWWRAQLRLYGSQAEGWYDCRSIRTGLATHMIEHDGKFRFTLSFDIIDFERRQLRNYLDKLVIDANQRDGIIELLDLHDENISVPTSWSIIDLERRMVKTYLDSLDRAKDHSIAPSKNATESAVAAEERSLSVGLVHGPKTVASASGASRTEDCLLRETRISVDNRSAAQEAQMGVSDRSFKKHSEEDLPPDWDEVEWLIALRDNAWAVGEPLYASSSSSETTNDVFEQASALIASASLWLRTLMSK